MTFPTASVNPDPNILVSHGQSKFIQIHTALFSSTSTTTGRSYMISPGVYPKWNGFISEFVMRKNSPM